MENPADKDLNRRMEINMKKINQFLTVIGITTVMLTIGTPLASAQVQPWIPRSAEIIRGEIEKNINNGINSYTVQWGDSLYAISKAVDIPLEQLMEMNQISNVRLIDVGLVLNFGQHNVIVSLNNGQLNNSDTIKDAESTTLVSVDAIVNSSINDEKLQLFDGDTTTPYTQEPWEVPVAVDSPIKEVKQEIVEQIVVSESPKLYALQRFMFDGVVRWNGLKFTYYSQSVLPGGGLRIPGRHINADGYVADGDGYIVLANDAPLGTVIDTPFGYKGKVYDRGTVGNHFDVYIR